MPPAEDNDDSTASPHPQTPLPAGGGAGTSPHSSAPGTARTATASSSARAALHSGGSRTNLLSASNTHGGGGGGAGAAGGAGANNNPPGSARAGTAALLADAPVNAVVFENTYKMKPDQKFHSEPVRRITEDVLQRTLTKVKYDGEKIPLLCQQISNEILASVKKLDYDRYKYVVDVTIGEFKGQGIRVASRAIWDTTTDSYASASFKNATLFAVAMVFGCYYE
ncbi:Tctex1 domain-containing protein 2 [Geranomyces variabilis]|uniref:Tctex1 domain-containing protein 2 n=1 Tax=Geranomyces variabilis TaxID=109894 RepID=A0AAD5TMS0_9FUNG|nr:Tctex1 domain-containing protein 2 [Geranomyces variabilis]